MATNVKALKDAIKLVADAAVDTEKVLAAGGGPLVALFTYKNLLPDLMQLGPEIGDIPAEVSDLAPEDYGTLVALLVTDLGLPEGHTKTVVTKALALLQTLLGPVVKLVEDLVSVIKAPPAAA